MHAGLLGLAVVQDLPQVQKGFLWVGLIMDLISKGGSCQLCRSHLLNRCLPALAGHVYAHIPATCISLLAAGRCPAVPDPAHGTARPVAERGHDPGGPRSVVSHGAAVFLWTEHILALLAAKKAWPCTIACWQQLTPATRCRLQVTVYWLSHYPSSVADVAVGDWRSPEVVAQDGKARATAIVHKLQGNKGRGTSATVILVY